MVSTNNNLTTKHKHTHTHTLTLKQTNTGFQRKRIENEIKRIVSLSFMDTVKRMK